MFGGDSVSGSWNTVTYFSSINDMQAATSADSAAIEAAVAQHFKSSARPPHAMLDSRFGLTARAAERPPARTKAIAQLLGLPVAHTEDVIGCTANCALVGAEISVGVAIGQITISGDSAIVLTAFISAWPIPQALGGMETVGYVTGPTACLQFPAKWTIQSGAVSDPQTLTWTPENPQGVYMFAFDSTLAVGRGTAAQDDSSAQGLWPFDGDDLGGVGQTPTFVPGSASGWSVTFPSRSQDGVSAPGLAAAAPCTP